MVVAVVVPTMVVILAVMGVGVGTAAATPISEHLPRKPAQCMPHGPRSVALFSIQKQHLAARSKSTRGGCGDVHSMWNSSLLQFWFW